MVLESMKEEVNIAPELAIGVEIYRHNMNHKPIHFSMLLEIFKDIYCRKTVNRALDKLFDLCMVDAEWKELDGLWVRDLYISGSAYKEYFKKASEELK